MLSTLSKALPAVHSYTSDHSDCSDDSRPSSSSSASSSASSLTSKRMKRALPGPATWVHLKSSDVSGALLQAIFSKYAESGLLGMCFADEAIPTSLASAFIDSVHICTSSTVDLDFASNHVFFSAPAPHLTAFAVASLRPIMGKANAIANYTAYVVEQPEVVYPPVRSITYLSATPSSHCLHPANVPTLEEWRTLWKVWDMVTLKMIPQEMLHQKPIDLRHKCLFYIGHIPTFLDMLLSKAVGGGPTEPKHFWNIFERGIDPHVDDPDHCHNHSEVPDKDEDWPVIETIMGFRDGVRARLVKLYGELKTGERRLTRNIARTLLMTLEHEGFHVETLLYMLIQRAGTGTLPPPGFAVPPWELLSQQWNKTPLPTTSSVVVGPTTLVMGHDDSEADDFEPAFEHDVDDYEFGWDNENPRRSVFVPAFRASWRPVTNGEYLAYLSGEGKGVVAMPRSWESMDEVKTMYGPVSMEVARHWPVLTAYDDLRVYARWKGGRLPTEAELRVLLDRYDVGYEGGANAGFRNWHPVPATMGLNEDGRGSNGGVWEWTSTVFDNHDGLVPTNLFTGYSVDFFDGKHQVVLGASYATLPRLCRRTVRNFYQHNYPYAWVAGRVVYDL